MDGGWRVASRSAAVEQYVRRYRLDENTRRLNGFVVSCPKHIFSVVAAGIEQAG